MSEALVDHKCHVSRVKIIDSFFESATISFTGQVFSSSTSEPMHQMVQKIIKGLCRRVAKSEFGGVESSEVQKIHLDPIRKAVNTFGIIRQVLSRPRDNDRFDVGVD
jgi:hypothetical protein